MVSTFTLNMVQSYYNGVPWELSYSGLINFGKFEVGNITRYCILCNILILLFYVILPNLIFFQNLSYTGAQIPIFLIMGVIGWLKI